MALSTSPSTPPEVTFFESFFDTLDVLPDEMLKGSMQKGLKELAKRKVTNMAGVVGDILKAGSITGTRILEIYPLPLDETIEGGPAWKAELQALAPDFSPAEFDRAQLANDEFLRKAVRMYLLELEIPHYKELSKEPYAWHRARALVIVMGDQPRKDQMIVDTRIFPEQRPSSDEEAARYSFTKVTQRNDKPTSLEEFMGDVTFALGRTIQEELKALERSGG